MLIEPALKLLLSDNADVFAVADKRIYQQQRPQGIQAASIIISLAETSRLYTFRGNSGVVQGTAVIDCIAPGDRECKQLVEATRQALEGFQGEIEVGGDTVAIDYLELQKERSLPVEVDKGAQYAMQYATSLDVSYQCRETTNAYPSV